MSRIGQGQKVFKTVLRYPVSRFKKVFGGRLVDRYPLHRGGASNDRLDVWNVFTPAGFTIDSVTVNEGGNGVDALEVFNIDVVVTNTSTASGGNALSITNLTLAFSPAEYTPAAFSGPVEVTAGSSSTLNLNVTAAGAITPGAVTVTPTVTASDVRTGSAVTVTGTVATGTFTAN